jgi:hypothetical protein
MAEASRFDNFVQKSFKGLSKKLSRVQSQIAYNFWKRMHDNDVSKSSNPAKSAIDWYKDYSKDSDVWHRRALLKQGHLYMFDYTDPKYKNELAFFDTQPLVLCLGHVKGVDTPYNNMGVNLHLLPPKVRRMVLFEVWQMYSNAFRKNLYTDNVKDVEVEWSLIKKPLDKYGIDFAIRSYIPIRQNNIIAFKQEDWSKAIWVPSAGYSKISAPALETEWREHVKKHKLDSVVGGENHSKPV